MRAKADNPDLAGIPQLPTPLRHDVQLYVQVYDVLYDMISGGQLKPGDLIPGECALAQHFGVSRGTVRQAIQYLEEDGLLTKHQGRGSEVVDRSVIRDWLVQGEDGSYTLDTDKVSEYVRQLGLKYDTFGLEHEFTKHDGTKITLAAGGDYGWCINKTATTDALIQAINDGVVESREPVYLYTAKSREENDIGDTYVEISIQEQRMWCYKDGQQIVDTPVVTGNVSRGFDTPSNGVWAIDAKKQDAILEGEGYASPVTFWLPFNGNVGIHDADRWRSEYGGEIYKTNGSHGCVNTPYENAEKIFNAVDIGTAVVVY